MNQPQPGYQAAHKSEL